MSEVKKYFWSEHEMIQNEDGDYVSSSDYDALKNRESRLREAAKDVVSQFPFIYGQPVPAWISNLEAALKEE